MGRKNYLIDTNIAIYYFGLLLTSNSETFLDEIFKSKYYVSDLKIHILRPTNISEKSVIY